MASLSANEQYLLELINRARLDPAAEAQRLGIDLNAGLAKGQITAAAKAPLAANVLLNDAADAHTGWMLARDVFSHTGSGGSSPGDRMTAAGYAFAGSWSWGENIAWRGTTGSVDGESFTRLAHDGLFRSAGHRVNLMSDGFREVGLGIDEGQFRSGGTSWNALMVTEDFARSGSAVFLTGVVYDDADGDRFYSPGEGRGGVTVAVDHPTNDVATTSGAAGGFAAAVTAGAIEVTFSGGGLAAPVSVTLTMSGANAKIDLVGGTLVQSSVDVELGSGAEDLRLLGIGQIDGTGNDLGNDLFGGRGNNRLDGGGGDDLLVGAAGRDTLTGGVGADRLDFNSTGDSRRGAAYRDTITDFERGSDTIDLDGIDASTKAAGNQDFRFIGTQGFHGRAGELHYIVSGGDAIVSGDVNGDGRADFEIVVAGVTVLGPGDFDL